MIEININKDEVKLDNIRLSKNETKIDDLFFVLGDENRVINLDKGINLRIYDEIGLRFWSQGEHLTDFQIVLNSIQKNVFPKENYLDFISINDKQIFADILKNEIEEYFKTAKDDDSQQYNVDILYIYLSEKMVCSLMFNENNCITTISI